MIQKFASPINDNGTSEVAVANIVTLAIFIYIKRSTMNSWKQKVIPLLKRSAIALFALTLLFFLIDDVVMPRYVQQGEVTMVPNVVGMPLEQAIKTLEEGGLEGKKSEVRQDRQYPEGTVTVQTPAAGAEVKFGRGIYLTVSGGETLVLVPGLRGRSLRDATLALERFGLRVGEIKYQVSAEYPENTIIDQSISEGAKVKNNTAINVTASQGRSPDRIPVPNVVRRSLSDAERIILQSGLKIGNITFQVNNDLLPNTVIEQYPRVGGFVPTGQAIDLFVTQKGEKKATLEN